MVAKERKKLMWDIRKSLFSLSPSSLFQIVKDVSPVPGADKSTLEEDDHEGCFDHICAYLNSAHHLESEDEG